MLEILVGIGVLGLLGLFLAAAFKVIFVLLGGLLSLIAFPFRVLGSIILLPLHILGWTLGLVLTLAVLPFVVVVLVLVGVGLVTAAAPLLFLALPVILLSVLLRSSRTLPKNAPQA